MDGKLSDPGIKVKATPGTGVRTGLSGHAHGGKGLAQLHLEGDYPLRSFGFMSPPGLRC